MKARFADHPRTGLFLFLAVYACVLVALLPVLSLWLDEIMDLMVVRSAGMRELLAGVAVNSGNAPLNYIIQFWAVHALGYSAFVGRLPEAIFSLASCAGIYVLARRLRLRWPLLAVAVFALFPLQFRYALEARPYSLALALSIWSTVAFFWLLDQPRSLSRAALYTLSVAAGIYVLPFTLFVAVAHLAWVRREMLVPVGSAIAIAALAFVPWYLHAVGNWRADPVVTRARETVTWRVVPMILHEVTGAGYVGVALVIDRRGCSIRGRIRESLVLAFVLVDAGIRGACCRCRFRLLPGDPPNHFRAGSAGAAVRGGCRSAPHSLAESGAGAGGRASHRRRRRRTSTSSAGRVKIGAPLPRSLRVNRA